MDPRRNLSIEDYPPVPALSWLGTLSPLVLVPATLPAIVLYLVPSDVLDAVPALKSFTAWMASHIPHLTGHAGATRIPQVATLVDCLVVVAAVLVAIVFLAQSTLNYRYLYRRHVASGPHPLGKYVGGLIGAPLMTAALAAMVMIPGDPSWAKGATQDRTLVYGFMAVTMPYVVGLVVGGTPLMVRLFLDAYLFNRAITIRER